MPRCDGLRSLKGNALEHLVCPRAGEKMLERLPPCVHLFSFTSCSCSCLTKLIWRISEPKNVDSVSWNTMGLICMSEGYGHKQRPSPSEPNVQNWASSSIASGANFFFPAESTRCWPLRHMFLGVQRTMTNPVTKLTRRPCVNRSIWPRRINRRLCTCHRTRDAASQRCR